MEVGQWRITTWTGPNRDSVYEWIRGRERERREREGKREGYGCWFLPIAIAKIIENISSIQDIWHITKFDFNTIVFAYNVSIILSEWFYSYPQNQYE